MADTLGPALKAPEEGLAAAARKARAGADLTTALVQAKAGRTAYINTKHMEGHVDPGRRGGSAAVRASGKPGLRQLGPIWNLNRWLYLLRYSRGGAIDFGGAALPYLAVIRQSPHVVAANERKSQHVEQGRRPSEPPGASRSNDKPASG